MRDRLVELLTETFDEQYQATRLIMPEQTADHLLANGVIVPPCKVGDVLYQVTRNFISEFRVRFIEIATCGNLFLHTDVISGIVYTGEIFPESEVGKTVFLTREEAEKALKGDEGNGKEICVVEKQD